MSASLKALPSPDDDEERRRRALDHFSNITGLPAVDSITQRGRGVESATYTMRFCDGREVKLGTIKTLWSLTEVSRVFSTELTHPLPPDLKAAEWSTIRTRLIEFAMEVDETPGESFSDLVRDWLGAHCETAGTDRDGAMRSGRPFIEGDDICVHVVTFARDIRRQYSATVKERELCGALGELGFERRTIMYKSGSKRKSASYYVAPLDVLNPGDLL